MIHTYISLLRGINVSGQKQIPMEKLKKCYTSLGLTNIQTYIQSGNVIFTSPETDISKLTSLIEKNLEKTFNFAVPVIIRTKEELKNVIKNNPYAKKEHLYVIFLATTPAPVTPNDLSNMKSPNEQFSIRGKEIYLSCPSGYGQTKLSNAFFERKLKVTATTRNWKTVTTLLALAEI